MRKFRVILDCDDVLFKCNEIAINMLNQERNTEYTLYDITSWGLTGTEIDDRLKYYEQESFFENLPVIEGAKEFVKALSKKAEIFICTNVPLKMASVRAEAIKENFPEIKPENILIGSRKDLLKADMMLDDCIDNLIGSNVDYPVLMQRPWNYNGNSGLLSVDGYQQFLELVDTIRRADEEPESYQAITLIGPSGTGKGKLAQKLEETGQFQTVKVYTTRATKKFVGLTMADFMNRKEKGFFSETSTYMGAFYGICYEDVYRIIEDGYIPIFTVDVNGAMAVGKEFRTLNVFVKSSKEDCIRSVLEKNLSLEETTARIAAIDSELKNEELCRMTVNNSDIDAILSVVKEGRVAA